MRARSGQDDHRDSSGQWQTIYCSLMLLLMVFFVMIAAWSTVESRKMAYAKNIVEKPKMDRNDAIEKMKMYADRPELKGVLNMEAFQGGFKAVVETPVLFAPGKADVHAQAYPMLNEIARMASDTLLFVTIEGHTDNTPVNTSEFPSNWELSTMRAVNVLRYLKNKGVRSDRISAVGYGEQKPIAGNHTEPERRKNRRIEIVFSREAL